MASGFSCALPDWRETREIFPPPSSHRLLPERINSFPPLSRLFFNLVVMRAGNDLDLLRTLITVEETLAELGGDHFIRAGKDELNRAAKILQPKRRLIAIAQKQFHGQKGH